MVMCNREGTFNAVAIEIGVGETGENKLATAVARYRLQQEIQGAEIFDISGENLEIAGYYYLEKKDGSLNERTINDLKAAFGWDGLNPYWLQDTVAQLPMVQIVVQYDTSVNTKTNQPRNKHVVAWTNPLGATGGGASVPHATDAERRALANRLGSKLRAMSGGTPAAMPPRPAPAAAPAPTAASKPPSGSKPPARGKPGNKIVATMNEAWEAFCTGGQASGASENDIQNAWFDLIESTGKTAETMTPEDWGALKAAGYPKPAPAAPAGRTAPAPAANGKGGEADLPF